jgi:two-component system, cell cycle sensor histidine kinase and response regulator CckA
MQRQPIRVLLLEDRPSDAELIVYELERADFIPDWTRVDTEPSFLAVLNPSLDVILSDFHMPAFSAPRALDILHERGLDIPFIVVSGSIGEETAIDLLKRGANDYLLKDRLSRLGQAVQRAIDERRLRMAKRDAEHALGRAEERIRFALEASRVGVWEADLKSATIQWSAMLEALHGLPQGGFAGSFQAFLQLVEPNDRRTVAQTVEGATRSRTDSNILYRTRWPDGTLHWISGSGRTFYDDAGIPTRAAGIALDVTERIRLEDQYRQAQKMEAVGQLAGGIAHDFNNLLTAIDGYCSLLADSQNLEPTQQEYVGEVQRAATRASGLTRQLLAFSRRQILEPRVIDLRDSITGLEPMLKRLIGEDIETSVRTAPERQTVKADPGQIEQVIMNLAINARDAMPTGGKLLIEVKPAAIAESHLRQGTTVQAGRYVMLAVSDTGEGMDAATQARIFEPFFTTKQKGKGTGLGLSTVYGIVKQSEGYIWLYSELGIGTTFKVYLPCVDEPVEHVTTTPRTTGSLQGTETILVVEDEPAVRQLVSRVLHKRGYTVLVASTPSEAAEISRTAKTPIHLLISDVVLPQMSGRAMAEQIVPNQPGIKVLYMSGYTDDAIVHHGVLDPGTPFLQKPFTPEALARKVREVLV